jgi:2-polyprenyl-3-methyl-5-hydroxy-6-metoxy-1,4-benzoquinol methylase
MSPPRYSHREFQHFAQRGLCTFNAPRQYHFLSRERRRQDFEVWQTFEDPIVLRQRPVCFSDETSCALGAPPRMKIAFSGQRRRDGSACDTSIRGWRLISSWIPALDGVMAKLFHGAKVADVGCGKGASSILMAKAFPHSHVFGFDYHDKSIKAARKSAMREGVADRVTFEVAPAKEFRGRTTILYQYSTACMTWVIQLALRPTSERLCAMTVHG